MHLQLVAGNLPDDQVARLKQMFRMMDTDKNGNLNFQELKDGLCMIGQPVPDHDVQMLLEAVSTTRFYVTIINIACILQLLALHDFCP